jgi:hypothetical protein
MKIKEITLKEDYKVTKIDPANGAELTDPANPDLKITMPIAQLQPDQTDPNKYTMNAAGLPAQLTGQPAQAPEQLAPSQTGELATGQPAQQPATGQQPAQPATGQQPAQPATGQQPQPPEKPKQPQVGSEVKLAEKSNAFDNNDLIKSGKNKSISGDPTNDFIDDVVDHDFEKHAGKSIRKVVKPEPVRESEELIAMLTIAGLR